MSVCRLCKEHDNPKRLHKYSIRHYAHFDCWLDHGGDIKTLSKFQRGRFPWRLLADRGWTIDAMEKLDTAD